MENRPSQVADCQTVTVPKVAKILGVSRNTAYEAAARDEIPGVLRIGRRVLISRAALEAWLATRRGNGAPDPQTPQ